MKVYLAGPITGIPDYRNRFAAAEMRLKETADVVVMNPAILPEGFEHCEYMRICHEMLSCCDAIALLPGWENSKGALMEVEWAAKWDIPIHEILT